MDSLMEAEENLRGFGETIGSQKLYACFECGHCSACCPVKRIRQEFSPRKIIHMVLLDMLDELISSNIVWYCTNCYLCQELCPQGIRIADLILELKNLSFKRGLSPDGIRRQFELLKTQGRIYLLDEFDQKKRKKAGLPQLRGSIDDLRVLLEG